MYGLEFLPEAFKEWNALEKGVRLVYTMEDRWLVVIVIAIGKREKLAVYEVTSKRFK